MTTTADEATYDTERIRNMPKLRLDTSLEGVRDWASEPHSLPRHGCPCCYDDGRHHEEHDRTWEDDKYAELRDILDAGAS